MPRCGGRRAGERENGHESWRGRERRSERERGHARERMRGRGREMRERERDRPLSQVGSRRKRCPGQFGQDGMGSIPATPLEDASRGGRIIFVGITYLLYHYMDCVSYFIMYKAGGGTGILPREPLDMHMENT